MKPKALLTHALLPEAMEFLAAQTEVEVCPAKDILRAADLIPRIADKEGLLCLLTVEVGRSVIQAAPRLRIIANCAAGFDNIDVAAARERGIMVTNTPGVLTETTAELTMALLLAVARRIPQADRYMRAGRFTGWKLDLFLGRDLRGKQLGIIGWGRIGREVARLARAFGMRISYYDINPPAAAEEDSAEARYLPLDELLRTSDVVSIHASLTPQAFHLLSRERIALMKKNAILVNVARGPIVDERALAEALDAGAIGGAGLDVYEREPAIETKLLDLDNVVLLPHLGSATTGTRLRMSMTAAKNLVQGLRGERPDNLIGPKTGA